MDNIIEMHTYTFEEWGMFLIFMALGLMARELKNYNDYQYTKYEEKGFWWIDRRDDIAVGLIFGLVFTIGMPQIFDVLRSFEFFADLITPAWHNIVFTAMYGYGGTLIAEKLLNRGLNEIGNGKVKQGGAEKPSEGDEYDV